MTTTVVLYLYGVWCGDSVSKSQPVLGFIYAIECLERICRNLYDDVLFCCTRRHNRGKYNDRTRRTYHIVYRATSICTRRQYVVGQIQG